jgi:RND superfamily putative drug exporter
LTEALARISARRPRLVVAIWVAAALIAGGLAADAEMVAGLKPLTDVLDRGTTTEFRLAGRYESERAAALMEERSEVGDSSRPSPPGEMVIIQSPSLTADDPAFRAKVESVFARIMALGPGTVQLGQHAYSTDGPFLVPPDFLVSADGRATAILFFLAGDLEEATENVEDVIHVVDEADAADDFRVLIGGDASVAFENNELSAKDLEQGERFGAPVALLILLALFGAVVAALLPIGLAIVAIGVAMAAAGIIGQAFELIFFVTMMITMIGLAVGIDYSLLIVSRFREEMSRGLQPAAAVARAGATAGRTVLFSGTTVVLALLGMLIVPVSFYQSLAVGAILVVLAALAATLTLLPAVLALLGPRVGLLTVPFLSRFALKPPKPGEHGFWEALTHAVTRYPIVSILLVGVPMVVLALFYFNIGALGIPGIRTGLNDVNTFPDSAKTKDAFILAKEEFARGEFNLSGFLSPAEIVVDGDLDDPRVAAAIGRLVASVDASADFPVGPLPPAPNRAGDIAVIRLPFPGEPNSRAATEDMATLRDELIPAAFEGVPAQVHVGGVTAAATDFYGIVDEYTPIVFAFVLGLSFLILMLVFRSIVIPIKAIIMNLLSVGATYGLLVLVFQEGVGADLVGFQHAEVIDAWIPLFLFTILFGLSMDYHVFLLSRIRERYDETGDNARAVAYGLRSTGGMITGAALIMVAVFGGFAAGETIVNQQVGFGLAVAVFLDATLVRSVLVPASMEVLGRGNWYLPAALRWLPDLRVEAAEEEETPSAPDR